MANTHAPTSPEISAQERNHAARVRRIAAEGMVLLENHGALPLQDADKKIALFGNGVRNTVKGGSGSGDVNCRNVISIDGAFLEAGYEITNKAWLDRYESVVTNARIAYMMNLQTRIATEGMAAAMDYLLHPFREPPVIPAAEEDLDSAAETAIYVLSRKSGEGADRKPIPGDYSLFPEEKALLDQLLGSYRRVILVLNVGGVIDSSFFKDNERLGAVLLMSQGGLNGARALVDVLTGVVTPSGHLTATWAASYEDYPGAKTFSHINGDVDDEYYAEGIYVGYRYFDTFHVEPNYPFGYGKSYTTFSVEASQVQAGGAKITVTAKVKNTGSRYSGRQVVQLYASAPRGKMDKPYQELVAFAKTGELAPGQEETLTLCFSTGDLASYDEEWAAWIMEQGAYILRLGDSSRNTKPIAKLLLNETAVVSTLQNRMQPDVPFAQLMPATSSGEAEAQEQAIPCFLLNAQDISTRPAKADAVSSAETACSEKPLTLDDVRSGKATIRDLTLQLTVEELAALCVGTAQSEPKAKSMIGAASNTVPGAAGDTTSALLESRKVPNLILADGPAGLRLSTSFATDIEGNIIPGTESLPLSDFDAFVPKVEDIALPDGASMRYQYCTAIPISTALAQTWDLTAIEAAGDLVGEEMQTYGVHLWLAPGMNIQRNPLCGRNFEYYSEDPFLSGKCAAAETIGVQRHKGCGTTIKHFACNNQEDNRTHTNAHVAERALREIYLRGFEIAVKEAAPKAMMTSYNLLNGIHTANHYGLITAVARQEWGYDGLVMTDWGTTGRMELLSTEQQFKYGCSSAAGCIKAGNDLIMPGSQEDLDEILRAVNGESEIPLTVKELRTCAERVLKTVLKLC